MRYIALLFISIIFFGKSNAVLTISQEKDEESIQKAKEINNVAKIFIKNNNNNYIICTATLITSNIMITAAHCVQDTTYALSSDPFPIQGFASFYADADDAFNAYFNNIPNSFIPIEAAIIHSGRDFTIPDSIADDVAFIRLTTNQEKPFLKLYKESLKPKIETLLHPQPVKNYNVDSFLMNCYGFGFGENVPNDSKRRYFSMPTQMLEQKDDYFHDLVLSGEFFGPFPNNNTSEFEKLYDLEERRKFNKNLIKKTGNPLYAFTTSGDSGSPLLYDERIIGIYSYGFPRDLMDRKEENFEFVLSLYGVGKASFVPLFDMAGKPIEKIYNMIPLLASFETEKKSTIENLLDEYVRHIFKQYEEAYKETHPHISNFFLECIQHESYTIDAWEFCKRFQQTGEFKKLVEEQNTYALSYNVTLKRYEELLKAST